LLEAGFDRPFSDTAIILLAAGKSSRFDAGDKLMAMYRGAPLIERSARLLKDEPVATRIAVVGERQRARTKTLRAMGWSVAVCQTEVPELAASISEGIRCASDYPVGAALILLADMPDVSERHLLALRQAITVDRAAVFFRKGEILMPPAAFRRDLFVRLTELRGDKGARGLFSMLPGAGTISIDPCEAIDIDTVADLEAAKVRHSEG
jgi:xanthine dehydrogenase accessory factor